MKSFFKKMIFMLLNVFLMFSVIIQTANADAEKISILETKSYAEGKFYTPGYGFNYKGSYIGESNTDGTFSTKLIYPSNNNQDNSPKLYSENDLSVSGNILIEGTFKIDNYPEGADFNPITLHSNGTNSAMVNANDTGAVWYGIGTVYIDDGEIRAQGVNSQKSTSSYSDAESRVAAQFDKICDFNEGVQYSLKLALNIDGDPSTFDTYYYTLSDGYNIYKGGPYYIGYVNSGKWGPTSFNLSQLNRVVFGASRETFQSYDFSNPPAMTLGKWTISKVDPITFEVNITDNETKVDKNSSISITFSDAVNEESVSNIEIYLDDSVNKTVEYSYTLSNDKKNLIIYPQLEYRSKYILSIPKSVVSEYGFLTTGKSITFYTDTNPDIAYFSTFKTVYSAQYGYYQPGYSYNYKGSRSGFENSDGSFSAKLIYPSDSDVQNSPKLLSETDISATGQILIEGTFEIDNYPEGADFSPLTLHAINTNSEAKQVNSVGAVWYGIGTVYIKDGEIRAQGKDKLTSTSDYSDSESRIAASYDKICDFKPGVNYTLKLNLSIDGDASTFDTYYYILSDGENTYTGGPYYLGYAFSGMWGPTSFNLTEISRISFGARYSQFANGTFDVENPPTLTLGTWTISSFEKNELLSSSVKNEDADVNVNKDIELTFSYAVAYATINNLKIQDMTSKKYISYTYSYGSDGKTLHISPELKYNRKYALTFPVSDFDGNFKNYVILFETEKMPIGIEVKENSFSGDLRAGEKVVLSVLFSNKSISTIQSEHLVASLYDASDGKVCSIMISEECIKVGESIDFDVSFEIPMNVQTPYIKVFAVDDILNMNEISNVLIYE